MKSKPEKTMLDAMSKNPDKWKGPFYFNRKDPRILVPKYLYGFGWTLNFASPYVYTILAGIVIIAGLLMVV